MQMRFVQGGIRVKALVVVAILLSLVFPVLAGDEHLQLIKAADAAFSRGVGFSLDGYEASLRKAISTYEQALQFIPEDEVQTRAYVLDRLSQGYFELGFAYLTDRDAQEKAFGKGKDYALASLRLDPRFVETEKESFRAALSRATDVKAVFWYGNNLGSYLNFHFLTALSGGMNDVKAAFERAIELDETYLGGGPWRAIGSFLAKIPSFLGGDKDKAQDAFARAIKIAPDFLENYVDEAEYVAKPDEDWDEFCAKLHTALEKGDNAAVMSAWPLYNALALKRAKRLISEGPCG